MLLEAETSKEVKNLQSIFGIFNLNEEDQLVHYAEAIKDGRLVHHSKPKRQKWYHCGVDLTTSWQPYKKLLVECTGKGFKIGHLDLLPAMNQVAHQWALNSLSVTDDRLLADGYVTSEDWNGETAVGRSAPYFAEVLAEHLGYRPLMQEFIPSSGGLYKHNPDYATGKRHGLVAAACRPKVFDRLVAYWKQHVATAEQLRIMELVDQLSPEFPLFELREGVCQGGHLANGQGFHYLDPNGTTNYNGKGQMASYMKWEEYKKL